LLKFVEPGKFRSLVDRALAQGVPIGRTMVWDISSHCERPYEVALWTNVRKKPKLFEDLLAITSSGGKMSMSMRIQTSCRKCNECLKRRSKEWARRSYQEIQAAPRTWFGTFTVSPENRVRFKILAGGDDFKSVSSYFGKQLTKYFKRLRKQGHIYRYVLVFEKHKDGFPHAHLLVHETLARVSKRELQPEWPYGFTQFKLVGAAVSDRRRTAWYCAKYLAKNPQNRIRASLRYGEFFNLCYSETYEVVERDTMPHTTGEGDAYEFDISDEAAFHHAEAGIAEAASIAAEGPETFWRPDNS